MFKCNLWTNRVVDVCALSGGFAFLSLAALLLIFAALLLLSGELVVGDLLVRALDDPLEVLAEVLVDGAFFYVVGVPKSNISSVWSVYSLKLIQGPLRVPLAAVFDDPSQHVDMGVIYCHF